MIVIKKILVPTDYSNASLPAIRYALSLARDHGAEVIVLNALPMSAIKGGDFFNYVASEGMGAPGTALHYRQPFSIDDLLAAKRQRLTAFVQEKIEPELLKGVKVTPLVRLGAPVTEIVAAGKEEQCDVIVMASRERSRLGRLISSGITEQVVRLAPCPVLSIQPSAQVMTDEGERVQSAELSAPASH